MLNNFYNICDLRIVFKICKNGYIKIFKFLYEINPKIVDLLDYEKISVLHMAAKSGNNDLIELLLSLKPELFDLSLIDEKKKIMLHYAILSGNIETVNLFLRINPGLISIIQSGDSILHVAVSTGNLEMVELFLRINPDLINIISSKDNTLSYYTILQSGASSGNLEMVKFLLKINPDLILKKDCEGNSILRQVIESGNKDMLEWLVQIEPKLLSLVDSEYYTALHYAATFGKREICEFLIQKNPELLDKLTYEGRTVLYSAIKSENYDLVEFLIMKKKELVDVVEKYNNTILHEAATTKNEKIVELILKIKPEFLYRTNNTGKTPLENAINFNNYKIVKIFLDHDQNFLNSLSNPMKTTLNIAICAENLKIIKLLLTIKPNLLYIKDNSKKTPHFYAPNFKTFEHLIKEDLELIDVISNGGESLLHIAVRNFIPKMVEFLILNHPKLINMPDKTGATPFSLALCRHYYVEKTFELLMNNGGDFTISNKRGEIPLNNMIVNYEVRLKYRKLEEIYITVKPIIDKIIQNQDLSQEESVFLKNIDNLEEDRENVIRCILNITKFEIKKALADDDTDTALGLIDSFYDNFDFEDFKLYKSMISEYNKIKSWEIDKFFAFKLPLIADNMQIIAEFLNFNNIKSLTFYEDAKRFIEDFRNSLLRLDVESASKIYKKLESLHDKHISIVSTIQESHKMLSLLREGAEECKGDDAVEELDTQGGAEESKGDDAIVFEDAAEDELECHFEILTSLIDEFMIKGSHARLLAFIDSGKVKREIRDEEISVGTEVVENSMETAAEHSSDMLVAVAGAGAGPYFE